MGLGYWEANLVMGLLKYILFQNIYLPPDSLLLYSLLYLLVSSSNMTDQKSHEDQWPMTPSTTVLYQVLFKRILILSIHDVLIIQRLCLFGPDSR